MSRVEEIAQAMRTKIEPIFLFGIVAMARHDYPGLIADLIAADQLVWAEQQASIQEGL